jgi:tRNA pseudouridine38-40 synthase
MSIPVLFSRLTCSSWESYFHNDIVMIDYQGKRVKSHEAVKEKYHEMISNLGDLQDISLSRGSVVCVTDEQWILFLFFHKEQIVKLKVVDAKKDQVRYFATVSYDGTRYHGFQKQSKHLSIQGSLEDSISRINGYLTRVQGSSRTDEGVHAFGQVIHFDTIYSFDEEKWNTLINHGLDKDIYLKKVWKVDREFHARYHVKEKVYQYIINVGEYAPTRANYEWTVTALDVKRLASELQQIEGTHDFRSFCKGEKENTTRTILKTKVELFHNHVVLTFVGDGFLRYMIRLLVGTAVRISNGTLDATLTGLLNEKSRKITNFAAPSGGLYLLEVRY